MLWCFKPSHVFLFSKVNIAFGFAKRFCFYYLGKLVTNFQRKIKTSLKSSRYVAKSIGYIFKSRVLPYPNSTSYLENADVQNMKISGFNSGLKISSGFTIFGSITIKTVQIRVYTQEIIKT